ncbi:hypothetical protein [Paenibacillus alvei]|uniref:Uncharacterized protein n=1 Tax=Paenibacillus alvei TaxID=44250 RepID=A0AAP7A0V6_PAEAL|nr:hypothetical protein [Paenibacillus alvei]NOJ73578.1 hypothetical protein [Paenibacillus alvei]
MWMQSKSGVWHFSGETIKPYGKISRCRKFNFGKVIFLNGDEVEVPPENGNVCKRCLRSK